MKKTISILLSVLIIALLTMTACETKSLPEEEILESSEQATTTVAPTVTTKAPETTEPLPLQYVITYTAKHGELTLRVDTVTKTPEEQSTYTAPEIQGYKFIGWADGITTPNRTDTLSEETITLVVNYEIEYLDMPIVIINTEEYQDITSKETYVDCSISIVNTEEEYCMDSASAGIRGRGNSTWAFDKKPYRIKFDNKQSLFGSSYKQKSWTLLANYVDKSLSRNSIAYELGEHLDGIDFTSMHQFVEVFLNGEYRGVYILCDQIQTGTGRVDIDEDLYDDGNTGYLIELDDRAPMEGILNQDYFTLGGHHYAIKTPDTEDEGYDPAVYIPFIQSYLQQCLDALNGSDWNTINLLMDIDSFVDAYIVIELFSNPDCGFSSFYMHKDRNGKLFCGPLWDFDIGAGNNTEALGGIYEKEWNPDAPLYATYNPWFEALFNHPQFRELVIHRLEGSKDTILSVIDYLNPVNEDGYYANYGRSFERNFGRWTVLELPLWNNTEMINSIHTVKGQQIYLRDWLLTRYYFMLNEIRSL